MFNFRTYNTAQLTYGVNTAASVSAGTIYLDTLPGVESETTVLFARVYYSWTQLAAAGAEALVLNATALPSSARGTNQTNYLYVHGSVGYATAFAASSTGVLSARAVNNAAPSSDWFDIMANSYSNSSGALIPFPAYWSIFLAASGASAWTAGDFTIDKIELYG